MLLQFKNLTIRNAETTDADWLSLWWNDGAIMAHAGFPLGLGRTADSIARDIRLDTDDTCRRLMIELESTPIGEMVYRNMGERVAEIGIKICDPSEQNKGYGKILLSMLLRALFEDLNYWKVILDTSPENLRAQRVYEELGFKKLRVRENAWQDQLGQWQAIADYELVPQDFINFAV